MKYWKIHLQNHPDPYTIHIVAETAGLARVLAELYYSIGSLSQEPELDISYNIV